MAWGAIGCLLAALITWAITARRIGRIRMLYYTGQITPHERDRLMMRAWWFGFVVAGLFGMGGAALALAAVS